MKIKILITAGILLVIAFIQPFLAMRNFSPVFDEISHLPAGYSYLKTKKIVLNPQHPPLIKILSAVPLLFLNLSFDATDPNLTGPKTNEWAFGQKFIYSNDANKIFFYGRLAPIIIFVILGFYIFKWANELFNPTAGIFALFLYAFLPNMLAHAQFVTTDIGVAAFSFITLYYLWKLLKNGGKKYIYHTGVALGLALGTKFSAVLLIPIILLLLAFYAAKEKNISAPVGWVLKRITAIYVIAAILLWILYFFPSDPLFYLKGFQSLYADKNPGHFYYLNGQFSQNGWWYYFLYAFLVKTPIPFLIILIFSLLAYKRCFLGPLEKLLIFTPITFFFFFTSWKANNMGVRYLMPIFPFLILYMAGVVKLIFTAESKIVRKLGISALVILGFWYMYSAIRIYPDYLAYFNEFAGGPENGYLHLDDSNAEWGNDLKRLGIYLNDHPDAKVVYPWKNIDLTYYGIKNNLFDLKEKWWRNPSGSYVLSTQFLVRAKLASQIYKEPALDWMNLYKPAGRIGYAFYIYEFNKQ